ncbi:hypothetical protein T265_06259 [Opisthorchis viverrini]|uniref:Uncharacterized protein n=1 Tax=Opisthorchis viverrini TaxID=6198 RepID=A0A074ZH57_OPIVI|nr:hypothetical protein T265_06259 [Opisthorchis viverrini]KER26543.1 hypothetical protein T265_06259 [Opisthorchis viverrini]
MHQFTSSRVQCAATYPPPKSSVNETAAATTSVRRYIRTEFALALFRGLTAMQPEGSTRWDIARLPEPRQGKSRGRSQVRTTDLPRVAMPKTIARLPHVIKRKLPTVQRLFATYDLCRPARLAIILMPIS